MHILYCLKPCALSIWHRTLCAIKITKLTVVYNIRWLRSGLVAVLLRRFRYVAIMVFFKLWLPNILLYILHENIHSNFSLSFVIVPTGCIRVDASFRCFELQRTSAYSWEAMGLLRGTRMQTCAARVDLLFPAHDQVRSVAKIFSRLSLYII